MLARLWPYGRLHHAPQGIVVVALGFLPILAIVSMFPAVPSLIAHFASNPHAGWLVPTMVSAPGLSIALVAPFAGVFNDRLGRRNLLVWATLAYGLLGAAPVFVDSLYAAFACRLLLGVTEAFILTGVNTLIADYWNDRDRRAWLSLQGIVGPFLSVGVILASGLVTHLLWSGAFLIYLVAIPIFFVARTTLFEPTRDGATVADLAAGAASSRFPWAGMATTGIATFAMALLYYVYIINGGVLFGEAGVTDPARLSQLTSLPSLCVILGAILFWYMRRMANGRQVAIAFLVLGAGLGLMGLSSGYRHSLWALTVQQTGAGMAVPALIAWAQSRLPFEHRGRGMGVWTTCFFLGQFCSPVIMYRLVLTAGSMHRGFICAGVAGIVIGLLVAALSQRSAGIEKAQA